MTGGGVGATLQAICRVRRGRISQGWVEGAATFAGRRADGRWCQKRFDGGSVCGGWNRVVDAGGGEKESERRPGLEAAAEWVRVCR